MFHKSMNMNRKGAASLLTNPFVVHWGFASVLLRERERERERVYIEVSR